MAPNISSSPQAALHDFLLSHAEELGQLISLGRDQILFEADDVSEHIYLVKRGRIKVFIRNHSGDPIELAILSEGALIGEMSLLGESTRSASCIALDEIVELVSISRDIAMDVIEADPSIRHALIVILTQRARDMVRFIHDFSGLTSLVSDGNYAGVQALINSYGSPDPAVRSAREAFKLMLMRIQEREASLKSTVATLSLEIDRQRAALEVESVMESALFKDLQKNAASIRERLKE